MKKNLIFTAFTFASFCSLYATPESLPPEIAPTKPFTCNTTPTQPEPLLQRKTTPTLINPHHTNVTTAQIKATTASPAQPATDLFTPDPLKPNLDLELDRAYTVTDRLELALATMRTKGLLTDESPVNPIAEGWTNHNFLAEGDNGKFFIKVAGKDTDILGINREREVVCHKIAAEANIAPPLVEYLGEADTFITEYVEGEPLPPRVMARPKVLKQVAQVIRSCHEISSDFPSTFNPFDGIREFRKTCDNRGVILPDDVDQAFALLNKIEKAVNYESQICPCHLDLHGANMVFDGRKIWLVDWEFAAMGNPLYDLASFASSQHLNNRQLEQLLTYYQGSASRAERAELQLYRAVADLYWALWAFLEGEISGLDKDYEKLGNLLWRRYVNTTNTLSFWRSLLVANPDLKRQEPNSTLAARP